MTKSNIFNKQKLISLGFTVLMVSAAFFTALAFRRAAGILAMTPLAFIICAAAAFLPIDEKTKTLFFGATTFCLNTIDEKNIKYTIIYTVIISVSCFVFSMGAKYIMQKKKKQIGIPLIAIGMTACIICGGIFMGNPFKASEAKDCLAAYTSGLYNNDEDAVLGKIELTDIYYNFADGTYSVTAQCEKYPSDIYPVSVKNGYITDMFKLNMEEKVIDPYAVEFTAKLREYMPNDYFSVVCDSVSLFPDESILSAKDGDFYGDITYEIKIGGVQTDQNMLNEVDRYMKVIKSLNLDYKAIIFKGGSNPWIVRSITVDKSQLGNANGFKIDYIPAFSSNGFNEFLGFTKNSL